ncbi:MAG: creatininase family protein, partial [Steroidobacteraceae bacterium]
SNLAALLAERRPVIVAPPISYGYARPTSSYPGTISIRPGTLTSLTEDVVLGFLRQGFHRVLILNGHYENAPFVIEGAELAVEALQPATAKLAFANWWDLVPESAQRAAFGDDFPGWANMHASFPETSLALALTPDIVREDALVDDGPAVSIPYHLIPTPAEMLPASGVYGSATTANVAAGEVLRDAVLFELERLVDELLSSI